MLTSFDRLSGGIDNIRKTSEFSEPIFTMD